MQLGERIILDARFSIASAFYTGSDPAALAAVAAASVRLAHHVNAGTVSPDAFADLYEVSENLGLVERLGADAVGLALDNGPTFYGALYAA